MPKTPPEPGRVETLEDGIRRLLAPNPGPMTHWGTNSYIVGEGSVAIVDPGPDNSQHLEALLFATKGERISHILITHPHFDHSPLARRLSEHSGAPILGFGPPEAGRSPVMQKLAASGNVGGGEGVDVAFRPDITLKHDDDIDVDGLRVGVVRTPGHFAGHLSFSVQGALMSGDHVMDWASSLVSPPDGDLTDFMRTSRMLHDAGYRRLYPGHGHAIDDAAERLDWLITHRMSREASILAAMESKALSLCDITQRVYTDIPKAMLPAARSNVLAHLIDLHGKGSVTLPPDLSMEAGFRLA